MQKKKKLCSIVWKKIILKIQKSLIWSKSRILRNREKGLRESVLCLRSWKQLDADQEYTCGLTKPTVLCQLLPHSQEEYVYFKYNSEKMNTWNFAMWLSNA